MTVRELIETGGSINGRGFNIHIFDRRKDLFDGKITGYQASVENVGAALLDEEVAYWDIWEDKLEVRIDTDDFVLATIRSRGSKSIIASAIEEVNHISKIIENGNETTFFLTSDEESGYWYWTVDTDYVTNYPGTVDDFVNDPDNTDVGSSVAYFDSLEDALADYNDVISFSVTSTKRNLRSKKSIKASTDSLYNRLLSVVDNPDDDIDTHGSDIYVLKTPETTKIVKDYYDAQGLKSQATTFIDNITHRPFYEIPFGYMNELTDKRRRGDH